MLSVACAALIHAAQVVFASGTEGFDTFRIPVLVVSSDGDLLAFAEGRKSVSDQAGNKIVMKRRVKGSSTWGRVQVIADAGEDSLNNPCVLPLPHGRLVMMFQRYPKGARESTVTPGYDGPLIMRSFVMESHDDGRRWGPPRDITREAKRDGSIRTLASGPGIGIRIPSGAHRGRLLFPFNERGDGPWRAFGLYSDDDGRTWTAGQAAPQDPGEEANEVQFAALPSGSVLMNARNQGKSRTRLQAISADGGQSWGVAMPVPGLPDPACMGALVSDGEGGLYFSNPADPKTRARGTIYFSADRGSTWRSVARLPEPSFAYSSLAVISRHRVGCLYETVTKLQGQESYQLLYREVDL